MRDIFLSSTIFISAFDVAILIGIYFYRYLSLRSNWRKFTHTNSHITNGLRSPSAKQTFPWNFSYSLFYSPITRPFYFQSEALKRDIYNATPATTDLLMKGLLFSRWNFFVFLLFKYRKYDGEIVTREKSNDIERRSQRMKPYGFQRTLLN